MDFNHRRYQRYILYILPLIWMLLLPVPFDLPFSQAAEDDTDTTQSEVKKDGGNVDGESATSSDVQFDEEGEPFCNSCPVCEECPVCPAPPPCEAPDDAELEILRALRQRRLTLEQREIDLLRREELLLSVERDLDKKIKDARVELRRIEDKLQIGAAYLAQKELKLNTLAASMRTLSARKAAPMLERIDPTLAAQLLVRLGPDKTGELLSKMDPPRAASLIQRLARANTPSQAAALKTKTNAAEKKLGVDEKR